VDLSAHVHQLHGAVGAGTVAPGVRIQFVTASVLEQFLVTPPYSNSGSAACSITWAALMVSYWYTYSSVPLYHVFYLFRSLVHDSSY